MNTLYDVQQLLRNFGTFIYTGNQTADLEMIQEELQELYRNGMVETHQFRKAILVVRREKKLKE